MFSHLRAHAFARSVTVARSSAEQTSSKRLARSLQLGKNKHVTEGHLTLFVNTFPNFSQSISNNHDFVLHDTQALP